MTKLIEDMARAIFRQGEAQRCAPNQGEDWLPMRTWEELGSVAGGAFQMMVREEAKAALAVVIASLREPSEGMKLAGPMQVAGLAEGYCLEVWQAMFEQWVKENA